MLKKVMVFILFTLSTELFADSDQVPMDRTITYISSYDDFVIVSFTPSFNFTQGCTHQDGTSRVTIDTTSGKGHNLYSAALLAALNNKKVGFGVSGCHTERGQVYRVDTKM